MGVMDSGADATPRARYGEVLTMAILARCSASLRALGMALLVGATAISAAHAGAASGPPDAAVTGLDRSLLDVMQHAKELGYSGRYARLEPVVKQDFDIRSMTRIAVGTGWSTLSQDQQDQLSGAFGKFITATYARRFDGYAGEKFETIGSRPIGSGMLVQTQLVRTDGDPVALNYVIRENAGGWQIVDVFLTGTISELAQRRSEFSAVFQRTGFDGLLSSLQQKIAQAES
jgi:phospholipid transport system substrate-binding protein